MEILHSNQNIVIIKHDKFLYMFESSELNRSCFCSQCYVENDYEFTFEGEVARAISGKDPILKPLVAESIEGLMDLAIKDCEIYIDAPLKASIFRLTYSIADLYLQTKLYQKEQIIKIKNILIENNLEHDFLKMYKDVF